MKRTTLKLNTFIVILLTLFFNLNIYSQQNNLERAKHYLNLKGELTFSFKINDPSEISQFSNKLSIVNYNPQNGELIVWANERQFSEFLLRGIDFKVMESENQIVPVTMSNEIKSDYKARMSNTLTFPLTAYPTYADYAQQMLDFQNDYPTLCQIVDIGGTTEGVAGGDKRLLFAKISANVSVDEQEPRMMYTSSMHGDEIAGYPMMLELINYLLSVYNDNGHPDHLRIKNLLDTSEIWINPSANPDGTYYNSPSNTSVASSRRANANGWDLNRNYPDNVAGPHADGNPNYELETQHFMNLADTYHFVLSANFHGGTEVVNYPWDNTYTRHPDNDWFYFISVEYAQNCQNAELTYSGTTNYMDAVYTGATFPGVTNGADWYRVEGGRQDYMNYYQQCKETTIELSNVKILSTSLLEAHWNYNKEALIEYLIQGTYGFRGIVKDAITGDPIDATITLVGHDALGSHTVTEINHGDYYRPTIAGTYDIRFQADCYESFTLSSQTIANYETKVLPDVLLNPVAGTAPSNLTASNIAPTTATISWNAITAASYDYRYRVTGSLTWTTLSSSNSSINLTSLTQSTQYEVQVRSTCGGNTSPYSSSIFFTTTTPPPCSGTIVTSFPYSESFESGIGDWYQDTSDNFDWTRNSGGTSTQNTGPTAASNGSWYMYTEANGVTGNAIFNSPCFNLNSKTSATLSFSYHMYGNQMGTLTLQYSINDGSSWGNLWTLSGNQTESWFNVTNINLTPYINNYVRLRFVGTRGNGNTSDMAIDNINLTAVDASITPIADCKNITITLSESGSASIVASDLDNGGSAGNLSIDISNFDCSNIGTNNVTLTATDPSDSSNTDSCIAVVTVNQQTAPTPTNCWDNYVYNSTSCIWENQGTQPTEPPAVNCWDNFVFNTTSCSWENTGSQDPEPPAVNCWDNFVFNTTSCSWENTGSQDPEPPAVNCWDNFVFNTTTYSWENTGSQGLEPSAVNCWDNFVFNTTSCAWENTGSQDPEPPVVNCWDNFVFNTTSCAWENTGSQDPEPPAVNCWDNYQFDTNTCSWVNQGNQPTEPITECWETATFNNTTCSWDITNDGDSIDPICNTKNITIQLDTFGNASITANDIDNGSSDNCGINSITLSQYNFDNTNVGDNTVSLTVTDHSGNSSSCDAIVTVENPSLGGIEEWNIGDITIYPNPFNESVNILVKSSDAFNIQMYDINGRLIYNINKITPINKIISIDHLKVEQGSYLLKIIDLSNGNIALKQLIKH